MTEPAEPSIAQLDSARLRTLAHPARARLLSLLRREGPATATALAQRLGTNSGQTSYHLRQLAEVGMVVEDTGLGTGRDRWWRAAHEHTAWSSVDFRDDPDDRAADDWLTGCAARMHARWTQDWLDSRDDWSPDWIDASDLSDYRLRLAPHQLRALTEELHA
ncbi:MAG TPA: helix-turn-helix domain-containing protein, partial [Euzebyales bacterium]|nr:helix-turn-helix domain-containing protein [Euzebyales bacterium]